MRSLVTLGVLSLVGSVAFIGCGDDDGGGNTGGSGGAGGSAGAGGDAGSAGTGGDAGSAGAAGSAGMAGSAGSTGNAPTADCTGCAVLSVPFTAAGEVAGYQLSLPDGGVDMSTAVITFNVIVYTPDPNLTLQITVQNAGGNFPGYYGAPVTALDGTAFPMGQSVALSLDMSALPGPTFLPAAGAGDAGDAGAEAADAGQEVDPTIFDKTAVDLLNLNFGAAAGLTGPLDALIAIDSIEITNVDGYTGVTFDAGIDGLRLNVYDGSGEPTGTPMPVQP